MKDNKRYTDPVEGKEKLYELLGMFIKPIRYATNAGTAISMLLTGFGVFIFLEAPILVSLIVSCLAPFLLDGLTHAFSRLFSESFFSIFQEKEKLIYSFLTLLFLCMLIGVGYSNWFTCTVVGEKTSDYIAGSVEILKENNDSSTLLLSNANDKFIADSLNSVLVVKEDKAKRKKELEKLLVIKNNRISEFKEYDLLNDWEKNKLRIAKSKRDKISAKIKNLNNDYKQIIKDSIDYARSRKLIAVNASRATKLSESKKVSKQQTLLDNKHEEKKSNFYLVALFIASISVSSPLIRYFYEGLRRTICGVTRIPKVNQYENEDSLLTRFTDAMQKKSRNFFELKIKKFENDTLKEQGQELKAIQEKILSDLREQEHLKEVERLKAEHEQVLKEIREQGVANNQNRDSNIRSINANNQKPNKAVTPAEHRNWTKKKKIEIIKMGVRKYPSVDYEQAKIFFKSLDDSSDVRAYIGSSFKKLCESTESKNSLNNINRSIKILMGSMILRHRDDKNVFVKNGRIQAKKRKEKESMINEVVTNRILTA